MTRFLIATSNKDKISEISQFLTSEKLDLSVTCPSDFPDLQIPDVVEDGDTYHANALKKAEAFAKTYQTAVLSDDSGIEIDGLNGGPGIYSARFGGEDISWPERWEAVWRALDGKEPGGWLARFRCVLCLVGSGEPVYFEGVTEGRILKAPEGENGFGYDPIFHSSDLDKSFGIATAQEKQSVSHRGRALQEFASWLSRQH